MSDSLNVFSGIYRGVVKDNVDPLFKGRCKVWVPSVYPATFANTPAALPWAEPVMSIFGGSFTSDSGGLNDETGVTSVPHIGTELWLFFEGDNHNYPKYFGICQSGDGWLSEHNNQHVIKTDNVRIRVDETPTDGGETTCVFNSFNSNCALEGRDVVELPTRVDIEVYGNVTIQIKGAVNLKVEGDVYEEITGNKHETLVGNLYRHHVGDTFIEQEGDINIRHQGDTIIQHTGNKTKTQEGDVMDIQKGNKEISQLGEYRRSQKGNKSELVIGNKVRVVSETNNESAKVTVETTAGLHSRTATAIIDTGALIDHKG